MSGEAQDTPVHYFVLHNEETLGPFSEAELAAGLTAGQFEAHDFAQAEGQSEWHPLGPLLGVTAPEAPAEAAPDWPSILKWAGARLRHSIIEQTVRVGAICLGVGALALALSHWPFVFWIPWFLAAAAIGIFLIRGKRQVHGALVLGGALVLPLLLLLFWPKARAPQTERIVENSSAESLPAPSPTPVPKVAPVPTPAPTVAPIAEATPVPSAPVSTPEPAPLTAEIPGLSFSSTPAAPAAAQPVASEATPPPSHPVSEYVMATASKLTDQVESFLTSFSKKGNAVIQESANAEVDWTRDYAGSFVIVKGSNGSGSGFICREGNQTSLFSNIHVVAKVKDATVTSLDGVAIVPGPAVLAAGRDVARFALSQPPARPLEAITNFDAEVHIGDAVLVLGNSGGGGVLTSLRGKVLGVGPDRVEVSSEFIPGNSGSPIIHVRTGKVIGLATYLTRRYEQFSSNPSGDGTSQGTGGGMVVRRFGYRIDKVATWEPVNWSEFYREAEDMNRISLLTQDIYHFCNVLHSGGAYQFATNELRRPAEEWLSKRSNPKLSALDRHAATETFLNALRFMVRGDIGTAEAEVRYSYFREQLREDKEVRERLYRDFDAQLARMSLSSGLNRPAF